MQFLFLVCQWPGKLRCNITECDWHLFPTAPCLSHDADSRAQGTKEKIKPVAESNPNRSQTDRRQIIHVMLIQSTWRTQRRLVAMKWTVSSEMFWSDQIIIAKSSKELRDVLVSSSFRIFSIHLTETYFHNVFSLVFPPTSPRLWSSVPLPRPPRPPRLSQALFKHWPNYVYNCHNHSKIFDSLWNTRERMMCFWLFLTPFQWSARLRLSEIASLSKLSLSFSSMEWHGMAWDGSDEARSDELECLFNLFRRAQIIIADPSWNCLDCIMKGLICWELYGSNHIKSIHINCSHPWVTCVSHCESKCYCYSSTCMDFVPDTTIGYNWQGLSTSKQKPICTRNFRQSLH